MALKSALSLLSALPCITALFASTPIHDLKMGKLPSLARRATTILDLRSGTPPGLTRRDLYRRDLSNQYPAYNLSVPVDHFHNESKYEPHSNDLFELRYWFDATHYKSGGPVILLESGEDTGEDRLPYLQKGIVQQLAEATNGVAVVLEHRYYGTSFPTLDLSTENLRFLTTQQALADTAYFAQNVKFAGLESYDLTAPKTAYIAYGGSYAGAFVAFLRTTYPDIFFGAIASSAVTEAIADFWSYYSPVAQYGPSDCISTTQKLINIVDNILINRPGKKKQLQAAFGLEDVKYANDFANVLSDGVGGWQGRNWDPAIGDSSFYEYCGNISSNQALYSVSSGLSTSVKDLINTAGYGSEKNLMNRMLNFIGWLNVTQVEPCVSGGLSTDECFSTHNETFYAQDNIDQIWRSWPYQYCTEWGFLQTGSGVPNGVLPLISRTIDLNYEELICRDAFGINSPPNTSVINAYGGYAISYSRLAFIDGEDDPWRGASPHAPQAPARPSTADKPFIQIPGAVHHWDENGLFDNETTSSLPPSEVKSAQSAEINFVKSWLQQFKPASKSVPTSFKE